MAEDDSSNQFSSNVTTDDNNSASGNDFYLLSAEDIASTEVLATTGHSPPKPKNLHPSNVKTTGSSRAHGLSASVDVEAIKRKAEELAKSLQNVRSKVGRSTSSSSSFENFEVRHDLKQHRERSLYVEQKLKEDRKLFEESKKRSEAVFDKVQSVKRIQESMNENVKELNRKDSEDTHSLKLKIQRLEDTVSRLQDSLTTKNRVISEKNEQIRTLNQSVSDTHDAYLYSLEQSEFEIGRVKDEYRRKVDEITSSKEELCNQLQLVRKNYLIIENDLKLSDFARSRLVNKNAELREKIIALEKDNEKLLAKLSEETETTPESSEIQADSINDLRPKIENLVIIANEFSAFLADDLNDIEELNLSDDDDVSLTVDAIGDKLEAAFFTMRDKLSSVPKLQSSLEKMNDELKYMESLLCKNQQQIAHLQQQLSVTQTKLNEEIKDKTLLSESIRSAESWQKISQNLDDINREILTEISSSDNKMDANPQLEQLRHDCTQLNLELESKSDELLTLVANTDDMKATIQSLQQERVQLLDEISQKSNECDNMRHKFSEVSSQLQALQQERSRFTSEHFQQMTHEYQLLQQTCTELRSKCDYLSAELQAKCEQVEKESTHHPEEQFEKEENDFVVLQTRDCDEDDNSSLKRQCTQLRDENEKLTASVRTMSEKAIEYENERLTFQQYVNECTHLQEIVKQLNQKLEAANESLRAASMASEVKEDDKDEEIEGLQDEMAKLAQQLSQVWNQLHDEKSTNHNLREQLGCCENLNTTMNQELQQQSKELELLRKTNEDLVLKIRSVADHQNSDEMVALQNHVAHLQKMLDNSQCECQAARNELVVLRNSLAQIKATADEVEDLKRSNHKLQMESSRLSEMFQHLEASFNETLELLAKKDADLNAKTAEAQRSFQELHETLTALNEAQCDLQFARADVERACRDLEDSQMVTEQTQLELQDAQTELHEATVRLHKTESTINELMEKRSCEVEMLQRNIAVLKVENDTLRQQCETHNVSYRNLRKHVNQIINAAKNKSDDAINIVYQLQADWPTPRSVANAETQYDVEFGTDQQVETETFELLLEDLRNELTTVQMHYGEVKQQLLQKDDECYAEVNRYVSLVAQLQDELASFQDRLTLAELELLQKNEDLQRQSNEFERQMHSFQTVHQSECQQYRHQMEDMQQKLLQLRKPKMVDVSIQNFDWENSPKEENVKISADEHCDIELAEVQLGDNQETLGLANSRVSQVSDRGVAAGQTVIHPTTDEESSGFGKYFGYYKEKMTKSLTDILTLEEQNVDYSNLILPDEPRAELRLMPQNVATSLMTELAQSSAFLTPKVPIAIIVDRLQSVISAEMNRFGWDTDSDPEWSNTQLQLDHVEFVDTALKFVDLFDVVFRYYSRLPAPDSIIEKFKDVVGALVAPQPAPKASVATKLPEKLVTKAVDCSKEVIEQVVTLTTFLENENKHLVDTIIFVEELIAGARSPDDIRFQSVIDYWHCRVSVDDDVIDRICEDYDIVPMKFVPGELLVQWKEQIARCIEVVSAPTAATSAAAPAKLPLYLSPINDNLQTLKKKVHKLICDLHYVYKDQETFNPVDFFAQIEDINHSVETTAKMVSTNEGAAAAPFEHVLDEHSEHVHDHELDLHEHEHAAEHHHGHGGHDHDHDHDHEHHEHHDLHEFAHEDDQRDTVADLKSLLGESNKKIDTLVKELMEVKSCREYNEVRQLHVKLDETLYQLHLRDVHVVELSRELAQLLAERDSLQLKLSNIIRQNEQLREMTVSNVTAGSSVAQLPDLENKLEELQAMNYMKDPRISETSKQYHATGMQLYNEEQRNKQESTASIVPSILKWFTGDSEN